jgi:hypothetical protein
LSGIGPWIFLYVYYLEAFYIAQRAGVTTLEQKSKDVLNTGLPLAEKLHFASIFGAFFQWFKNQIKIHQI